MQRAVSNSEFSGTGRFQILRRLGEGGMGVVYEALDREQGARVALKTLRPGERALTASALLRFKNEFRALQDLHHPNLVRIGELFEEGGQWFFTMELVDGVDFLSFVRPTAAADRDSQVAKTTVIVAGPSPEPGAGRTGEAPFSPGETRPALFDEARLRDAMRQLALGVSALHAAGKVHRDIKPSNIRVTEAGRVVLLDFGLVADALEIDDLTERDHVVGSVSYMAPEQVGSKLVAPEGDWYSVGALLYHALLGRPPHTGAPREILRAKQQFVPPSPRAFIPAVPEDLDELCKRLLRINPAERPERPEVLAALGAAPTAGELAPVPVGAQAPLFVGRRSELADLRAAFDDTRRAAVAVLIQGESGVGKSAMVRHFTEAVAATEGAVVLAGRCYERESVPYKAFDGLVDALSRHMMKLPRADAAAVLPRNAALLAQVFPVLRRIEAVAQAPLPEHAVRDPQELRVRVFAALRALFGRLAARCPLVLVIDDLQWTDSDSLALLRELLRPPDAPALLLIATVRVTTETMATTVNTLELPGDVRHYTIDRLPPEQARELATRLVAERAPALAAQAAAIAEEAEGHPLFIDELVRFTSSRSGSSSRRLRLEEALWSRISELDPDVRQVLEIVALAGVPLPQEWIAQAAALDFAEFFKHAAFLRSANLVRTGGARRADTIEPYHDRIRDAVLGHVDATTRTLWHERLALALEGSGRADPEALAVHWRGAGVVAKAARYAGLAADQAADALAFDRAARLYRLSLELVPGQPAEARAVRVKLADALANAGRGPEAAESFLAAAATGGSGAENIELRRRAAEQLLMSGHTREGLEALREVLAAVGLSMAKTQRRAFFSLVMRRIQIRLRGLGYRERDPSEHAASTLMRIDTCWSAAAGLAMVDNVRGADFQSRHLQLSLRAGEPFRIARSLAVEAAFVSTAGAPAAARAARLRKAAEALALRLDQPMAVAWTQIAAGTAEYMVGHWKLALARCEEAERTLRDRCRGVTWELDTMQLFSVWSLFFLGDHGEFARRARLYLREAQDKGDRYAATNLRTGAPNLVWLFDGDVARARAEAREAMERWPTEGFHIQHFFEMVALVNLDLYGGDGRTPAQRLAESWPRIKRSTMLHLVFPRDHLVEMRARCALASAVPGAPDRLALARAAERDARRLSAGTAWREPWSFQLRAGAAVVRGRPDRAVDLLAQAATAFDGVDMALYAVVARRRRGELLGGDEGRDLVAAADAWMRGQGIRDPDAVTRMLAPGFASGAKALP